ncbi:MAG TPA: hypothetical protein VHZ03_52765 [Trebonia sp.]|jgi:hypothetical protein|nr:hypothetical protein [Trebonia sp.]
MSARHASEGSGLVGAALRCYPARWRQRHEDEAAELAALLIRDGTPAASVAWSYLVGAARAWLTPPPGRSLSTVAAALLAATCLLGSSAALVAETVPAKAAGTTRSPFAPVRPTAEPAPRGARSGSPRQLGQCRPIAACQVTRVIPAAGNSQLSIQGTAHARSC